MTYIKAVQLARANACIYGKPFIVFGIKRRWFGWNYKCGDVDCFQYYLDVAEQPVVKYLMCMPNGVVVQ